MFASNSVPHRIGAPARPDDDDRPRGQHGPQARDVGPLLALGQHVQIARGGRQIQLDVHLPAVAVPPDRQPRIIDHLPHPRVLRQHVSHEAPHTPSPGAGGQVLQQQRTDPHGLRRMRHSNRDLGRRGIGVGHNRVRHTDQSLAPERADGHIARMPPHQQRRHVWYHTRTEETEEPIVTGQLPIQSGHQRGIRGVQLSHPHDGPVGEQRAHRLRAMWRRAHLLADILNGHADPSSARPSPPTVAGQRGGAAPPIGTAARDLRPCVSTNPAPTVAT